MKVCLYQSLVDSWYNFAVDHARLFLYNDPFHPHGYFEELKKKKKFVPSELVVQELLLEVLCETASLGEVGVAERAF